APQPVTSAAAAAMAAPTLPVVLSAPATTIERPGYARGLLAQPSALGIISGSVVLRCAVFIGRCSQIDPAPATPEGTMQQDAQACNFVYGEFTAALGRDR